MTKLDERTCKNWRTWYQRRGPGTENVHAWFHSSATSAIEHIRKHEPNERVRFCPTSGDGKREAEEATRGDANIEVGDFQIWIVPINERNNRWSINPWRIRRSGRATTTGTRSSVAPTAAAAIARVLKQSPNAAIRLPAGNADAQAAAERARTDQTEQPLDLELVDWTGPGD